MVPGDDHGSVNSGRRRPGGVRPAGQRTGHVMSSATYRTLLRAPGAAAFFLTAAAGRVGIAMTSLGIVWLVHARTGAAGTAAALFTVSSCASLLAGWLYGLRRWRTAPRVQLAVGAAGLAGGCVALLVGGAPA